MELVDGRRLTGPNRFDLRPGAIVEVRFADGEDRGRAIADWEAAVGRGLARLGWTATIHTRLHGSGAGAELMFTAEVDRLYAASRLGDWAVIGGERKLEEIVREAASEQAARRGTLELIARAEREAVPWLIDDERFSLGYGAVAHSWPIGELPGPDSLDWSVLRSRVPIGLITGTNGKTTCARLLARIARLAGRHVGNTSTDGISVDECLVDAGDWTGPGAARNLLRRHDIDFALLEVARGGMLRRGLGVPAADAALITNVSNDHLGEYGIETVAELAEAKGIVASVVVPSGRVVLGAESRELVEWARGRTLPAPIVWFSVDPDHPVLLAQRRSGGESWTVIDGSVCRIVGDVVEPLLPILDIPLTIAGRARHNIANVLAVAALAQALGLPTTAIVAGLREFGSAPDDNPGRARCWTVPVAGGSVDVMLDFAHNQAGLATMAELVVGLGRSVLISFGMAGDRTDAELRALGAALAKFSPRIAFVREQEDYLRGRPLGVVPRLIAEGLSSVGVASNAIVFVADEPSALAQALAAGRPGELIVHLVHTDRERVAAWLEGVGARPSSLVG